jgi:membrane associated rhomboid family serine protease
VSKPRKGGSFFSKFDTRITRGSLILLFAQVGISLVWLLSDEATRADVLGVIAPTMHSVFDQYRVWTVVTGPFIQTSLFSLLFTGFTLWMFTPTLERFWGMRRFLTFFAATSLAGSIAGTLMLYAIGDSQTLIIGYDPFVFASIVAFGILYARQPVQFFGVLPMTGRQLMYGILGFVALFILIGQLWAKGIAYVAAIGVGAMLASGRWNPRLWWYKWRHARARKKLAVLDGGRARPKKPSEDLLN